VKAPRAPHVAGVLHPGGVAGVEEDAGGEVEGLLRAGGDDDLFPGAADAAGGAEILGDGAAERGEAGGVGIAHAFGAGAANGAGGEAGPELSGKNVERGDAGLEGLERLARSRRRDGGGGQHPPAPGETGGGSRFGAARDGGDAEEVVGDRGGDERAGAHAAFEVALGEQLVESGGDGVAGDGEVGGKSPGGGEAAGRRDPAGENSGAELVIELALKGEARAAVEMDREKWPHGISRNGPFQRATLAL
jgi:hypothetical protein